MGQRRHLGALTGLRFFAAAAIVIHHISGRLMPSDAWNEGGSLAQGVSIFFVLSGFILTYQYRTVLGFREVGQFIYARAAKVFPSHLAALGIWFFVFGYEGSMVNLLANLLLLQSWVPVGSTYFAYNSVSWSLSTEMAFYAAFPVLLYGLRLQKAATLGSMLLLGALCVWAANAAKLPGYAPSSTSVDYLGIVMVNPLARLFEFTCGMAACTVFLSRDRRTTRGVWSATALEFLAVALVLFNLTIAGALLFPYLPEWGAAGSFWFGNSLAPAVPAALLIYLLARGEGVVSRVLASRPVRYLGATSFALYLLHPIIAYLVETNVYGSWALPVFVLASLAASALIHECVELPAQRFLRTRRVPSLTPAVVSEGRA